MAKFVKLKKGVFESAKVSVKRGNLLTQDKFNNFVGYSFDEILKYLEEHGFRKSIDSSYLHFEGFYLIEKILNMHLSRIYSRIFASLSKSNKFLFETFYFKYQVHNFMIVIRGFISKEENIEPFLIGDERKKSKFLKAYEMPNKDDAVLYLSKKLKLSVDDFMQIYQKGEVYEIENYLYKVYYERLKSFSFKYNFLDELKFFKYIQKYIDLINSRSYMKLKIEETKKINFEDIFAYGGSLSLDYFNNFQTLKVNDVIKELAKEFGSFEDANHHFQVSILDKKLSEHKKSGDNLFRTARFGSPFYLLRFLFETEQEASKLRILLKAKYLGLSKDEVSNLI